MFANCPNLNYIKIGYEGYIWDEYFGEWHRGVSDTGDFYYNGALADQQRDTYRQIPTNWTVHKTRDDIKEIYIQQILSVEPQVYDFEIITCSAKGVYFCKTGDLYLTRLYKVGSFDITWDGSIDGRPTTTYEGQVTGYHVSDKVLSLQQLIGATAETSDGYTFELTSDMFEEIII